MKNRTILLSTVLWTVFFCNICKLILTQGLELYLCIYETLYLCYVRMSLHSHRNNMSKAIWIQFSIHFCATVLSVSENHSFLQISLSVYKTKNKVKCFPRTDLCKGSWLTSAGHMTYPPHHFAISAPELTQHIVNSHVFSLKLKGSQFL